MENVVRSESKWLRGVKPGDLIYVKHTLRAWPRSMWFDDAFEPDKTIVMHTPILKKGDVCYVVDVLGGDVEEDETYAALVICREEVRCIFLDTPHVEKI